MTSHWIAPRRIGVRPIPMKHLPETGEYDPAFAHRHYRIEDEADIRWLVLGLALVPWVAIVATLVL